MATRHELNRLRKAWRERWEAALAVWSRFTKLSEPRWCVTGRQAREHGLTDSFAMIRLQDHAVVINLGAVQAEHIESFATEILAHEIGHHVYAPGDLRDNARLIARVRAALPSRIVWAGIVSNLYTDLLINDRLQRAGRLDMAGVYKKIETEPGDKLWTLYMRIYEVLWKLEKGSLAHGKVTKALDCDAQLGARVIRAYAKDWLDGAGRFAALCLPYLLDKPGSGERRAFRAWLDTEKAGESQGIPDGLAAIEDGETDGALHPSADPALTGLRLEDAEGEDGASAPKAGGTAREGGRKNAYRSPAEYKELMQSVCVKVSEAELVMNYYRERALPYLVRFPTREVKEAADPQPEGTETWDVGRPIGAVDWVESVVASPYVVPGVTTVQRTYGTTCGSRPEQQPVDLYLGVDCSGSMHNPSTNVSYPVLAGTVIVLSALRAGARAMVTLSGEPGKFSSTDGFIRRQKDILKILTGYLGTGYAFGALRLKDTFVDGGKPARPVHILIVTDSDFFQMLGEVPDGWQIAQRAAEIAGGGATCVMEIPNIGHWATDIARLRGIGWHVHIVTNMEQLVDFARAFSKEKYEIVNR
ncbi:MAG: VWA domain-containing protein [Kiritimatiellae bacterium]|nr:VWA domain-containing protein [Kiritimatiellia bacterium]